VASGDTGGLTPQGVTVLLFEDVAPYYESETGSKSILANHLRSTLVICRTTAEHFQASTSKVGPTTQVPIPGLSSLDGGRGGASTVAAWSKQGEGTRVVGHNLRGEQPGDGLNTNSQYHSNQSGHASRQLGSWIRTSSGWRGLEGWEWRPPYTVPRGTRAWLT